MCASRGHLRAGVPQGSILGPLLFSVYVNDLPTVTHNCQLNMSADDMEIHCSNADLSIAQHCLQNDLDSVRLWLQTNLLSPNVRKSHAMLIDSRQNYRIMTCVFLLEVYSFPECLY